MFFVIPYFRHFFKLLFKKINKKQLLFPHLNPRTRSSVPFALTSPLFHLLISLIFLCACVFKFSLLSNICIFMKNLCFYCFRHVKRHSLASCFCCCCRCLSVVLLRPLFKRTIKTIRNKFAYACVLRKLSWVQCES